MSVKNLERGGGTMRKILLVTLVAGLLMSLVSLAWADQWQMGSETQVWKWDEQNSRWAEEPKGAVDANARAWHQVDINQLQSGNCNNEKWEINVATHASVAQWINWTLSAHGWNIRVRKPGIYIADCISASTNSNADVLVTFKYFDDLKNDSGEAIETWYALGGDTTFPANNAWVKAKDLNNVTLRVPYCYHSTHLWIKIYVRGADDSSSGYLKTRACEYQNDAKIYLSVTVLKNWIDRTTGDFAAEQPPFSETVTQTSP